MWRNDKEKLFLFLSPRRTANKHNFVPEFYSLSSFALTVFAFVWVCVHSTKMVPVHSDCVLTTLHIKVFPDFFLCASSTLSWEFGFFLSFHPRVYFNTCPKRIICFVSRYNRITQGHVINYMFGVRSLVFVVCWLLKLFGFLFIQFDQSYLHYFYYTLYFFALFELGVCVFPLFVVVVRCPFCLCVMGFGLNKNFSRFGEMKLDSNVTNRLCSHIRFRTVGYSQLTHTLSHKFGQEKKLMPHISAWMITFQWRWSWNENIDKREKKGINEYVTFVAAT